MTVALVSFLLFVLSTSLCLRLMLFKPSEYRSPWLALSVYVALWALPTVFLLIAGVLFA